MRRASLTLLLLVGACAEDIQANNDAPDAAPVAPGDPDAAPPSRVRTTDQGDGTFVTQVDASAMDAWVTFDFASRSESEAAWDLAFKRFEVKLDGGVSGAAGVQMVALPGADFAAVTAPPADGWITDTAEALAFSTGDGWYSYNPSTHVLSPRPIVYVVRTSEGDYVKLAFTDYYDEAGSSGHPSFRWAKLEGQP